MLQQPTIAEHQNHFTHCLHTNCSVSLVSAGRAASIAPIHQDDLRSKTILKRAYECRCTHFFAYTQQHHIPTYIHTDIYTYTCIHITHTIHTPWPHSHTQIQTYMSIHRCTHACTCTHMCTYTGTHTCIRMHLHTGTNTRTITKQHECSIRVFKLLFNSISN